MSNSESPQRSTERLDQLLFGAMAGLSVAFILQMIDKQPMLDNYLGAALFCVSAGLPIVASSFLLEVADPLKKKGSLRRLFDLTGVLLSLAGFGLSVFHIQLIAGGIFLASVGLCFVMVFFSLR
jgi:hypothetical protein